MIRLIRAAGRKRRKTKRGRSRRGRCICRRKRNSQLAAKPAAYCRLGGCLRVL